MALEQIRQLMAEIGPAMDLAGVAEYGEEAPSWVLLVGNELELLVDYDARGPELILSALLGQTPAQGREDFFQTLLLYNGQREQTGGVVISLLEPDGDLVQTFSLPAQGLELVRLMQVVGNFAEVWDGWRAIIQAGATTAEELHGQARTPVPPGGVKV